jgi:UDP-N-acetylmuramoylalanine--D-glutamate ligase
MKEKLQKLFVGKKILILGVGREGESTLRFLNKFLPEVKVNIADQKFGADYLDNLKDFDLVIKSPGIPWKLPKIDEARKAGSKFSSQTQVFLDLFCNQTIGVTGTKGKSTTASLIYNILRTSGKEVKLVGNIGNPVLDYIESTDDKSLFVYEMSSHQLSGLTISPHIAVLLNIYPEHLDYYSNFEEYFKAKTNIAKYQTEDDFFIYNSDFSEIVKFARTVKSKEFEFSSNSKVEGLGIELKKKTLIGIHNKNNILASILVAQCLGIENKYIEVGIETFKPLEDRLEKVREIRGVTFINDGLATIPQATMAAVDSFPNQNLTLILGGFDRGISFKDLGEFLARKEKVENAVLIGQTADKIEKSLQENKFNGKIFNLGKVAMKEIVDKAYEVAKPKGVVLLSPAATSFDMFKDYRDRDAQFKKAVSEL